MYLNVLKCRWRKFCSVLHENSTLCVTERFGRQELTVPRCRNLFSFQHPQFVRHPAQKFFSLSVFFLQVQQHLWCSLPWTYEPRNDKVSNKVIFNLWHVALHPCGKNYVSALFWYSNILTGVLGVMVRVAVLSLSLSEWNPFPLKKAKHPRELGSKKLKKYQRKLCGQLMSIFTSTYPGEFESKKLILNYEKTEYLARGGCPAKNPIAKR